MKECRAHVHIDCGIHNRRCPTISYRFVLIAECTFRNSLFSIIPLSLVAFNCAQNYLKASIHPTTHTCHSSGVFDDITEMHKILSLSSFEIYLFQQSIEHLNILSANRLVTEATEWANEAFKNGLE